MDHHDKRGTSTTTRTYSIEECDVESGE